MRQAASLTLTDVHQVKVLADPLRIRILEELCKAERTTKQVAQLLGEKPTKLYHHVEALERVGLIRLARTRPNRGTTEKYYISVARQFNADSRIFSAADAGAEAEGDALQAMIATVFDRTAGELRDLVAQNRGSEGIEEQGVLSYLEVRTDDKHARQLRARLMRLIKSLDETHESTKKSGEKRYRLTIAFYPLDPDAPGPPPGGAEEKRNGKKAAK
ncbi:MAG TPA: helix-turn-helix domain-containing protein [Candidatus Krumholzibacteria bacterium]|nr:helix-turn-helix domain-containing protein [Candidatus Krumholzibacteria bacterium]